MNIIPPSAIRAILDAIAAATQPLNGAVVRLFKNNLIPDQTTVLADYEEADFTGYAESSAVVWESAFTDILGQGHVLGDLKTFAQTAVTVTCTVYGWYLVNGTTLLAGNRFDVAQPMNAIGNAVNVVPSFELKGAAEPVLP